VSTLLPRPVMSIQRDSLKKKPFFILITTERIEVFGGEPSPRYGRDGELFRYNGQDWSKVR